MQIPKGKTRKPVDVVQHARALLLTSMIWFPPTSVHVCSCVALASAKVVVVAICHALTITNDCWGPLSFVAARRNEIITIVDVSLGKSCTCVVDHSIGVINVVRRFVDFDAIPYRYSCTLNSCTGRERDTHFKSF